MPFQFTAMTLNYARTILEWKYDGPYAFYNYEKSAPHLLDSSRWGKILFAVLDETGQLAGELTVGFLNSAGEWVSQAEMDAGRLDNCILWIGFGMRPDLTGQGLGLSFVNRCVDFAIRWSQEQYQYTGEAIGLGVYQFNQRAIKVYERAGFVTIHECSRVVSGQALKYQHMHRLIHR